MALSDLKQALDMFNSGLQEYAVSSAIRGATEQVQQINMQSEDEFKRRQGLQELGQGLALQLGQIGASPQQIQQAAGAIMPRALGGSSDLFSQGLQAQSPEAQEQLKSAARELQAFEQVPKMQALEAQQAGMKERAVLAAQEKSARLQLGQSEKFSKQVTNYQKQYNSFTKKADESIAQMDLGLEAIDKNSIIGIQSLPTIFAKSVAREVGALSEADKAPYKGLLAAQERIKQWTKTNVDPNRPLTARNKAEFKKLLDLAKNNALKLKENIARSQANQLRSSAKIMGANYSQQEAMDLLTGGAAFGTEEQAPAQVPEALARPQEAAPAAGGLLRKYLK